MSKKPTAQDIKAQLQDSLEELNSGYFSDEYQAGEDAGLILGEQGADHSEVMAIARKMKGRRLSSDWTAGIMDGLNAMGY